MRVLISGANGFVGRHLSRRAAAEGATVVGLGRADGAANPWLADYLAVDVVDAAAAREAVRATEPERVFHLAADASVARSWESPGAVLQNNLLGTLHLLEALRADAPRARVLVAGSGEEYGPVPERRLPVTEDEPLRPLNPYAVSKASAGLLAGLYADTHGLDVVRTRAFNHAGPGQAPSYVIASFARQIAAAETAGEAGTVEIVTGNVAVARDFTDVRDVVRAYWLALDAAPPDVYNVCSGSAVPVAEVLRALARHTQLELAQRTDPALVRAHDVMQIRGSHERLSRATGWRPRIPLDRTLRDTLDWWRERLVAEVSA